MKLAEEIQRIANDLIADYEKEAKENRDELYQGVANKQMKLLSRQTEIYVFYAKQLESQLSIRTNFDELLFRTIKKRLGNNFNETIEDYKNHIARKEPALSANLILSVKEAHEKFMRVFKQFESECRKSPGDGKLYTHQ